ncbi:MAG: hypothetical protein LBM08_00825 [Dysgonamonadaceae bacterium]|jgi:hypothetical protein|nr:hypothetical protein [Dysgonamonadaceae bacterium]
MTTKTIKLSRHYAEYAEMLGKPNVHSVFEYILDTYLENATKSGANCVAISLNEISKKRHISRNTIPAAIEILESAKIITYNKNGDLSNSSVSYFVDLDRFASLVYAFTKLNDSNKKSFTQALYDNNEKMLESLGYALIKNLGDEIEQGMSNLSNSNTETPVKIEQGMSNLSNPNNIDQNSTICPEIVPSTCPEIVPSVPKEYHLSQNSTICPEIVPSDENIPQNYTTDPISPSSFLIELLEDLSNLADRDRFYEYLKAATPKTVLSQDLDYITDAIFEHPISDAAAIIPELTYFLTGFFRSDFATFSDSADFATFATDSFCHDEPSQRKRERKRGRKRKESNTKKRKREPQKEIQKETLKNALAGIFSNFFKDQSFKSLEFKQDLKKEKKNRTERTVFSNRAESIESRNFFTLELDFPADENFEDDEPAAEPSRLKNFGLDSREEDSQFENGFLEDDDDGGFTEVICGQTPSLNKNDGENFAMLPPRKNRRTENSQKKTEGEGNPPTDSQRTETGNTQQAKESAGVVAGYMSEKANGGWHPAYTNYKAAKARMQLQFFPVEEIETVISNLPYCLDRSDKIFINQLWDCLLPHYQFDEADEDGNITVRQANPDGLSFEAADFGRCITRHAYDATVQMIEEGRVNIGGTEYPVTAKPFQPDETDLIIDFQKTQRSGRDVYIISKKAFKDIHAQPVPVVSRLSRPGSYEGDMKYMQEIILRGDDDNRFRELTPIELAIYNFLIEYFEINDDGTVEQRKQDFVNRQAMCRFYVGEVEKGGMAFDDIEQGFASVVCNRNPPENGGGYDLRTRMFSACLIKNWNDLRGFKSVIPVE